METNLKRDKEMSWQHWLEQKDGQIVELIKKSSAKLQKKDEEVTKKAEWKGCRSSKCAESVIMTIFVIMMKLEQEVAGVR